MSVADNAPARMPTFFIPHGGGPCFFMDWPDNPHMWDALASFLRSLRDTLATRPRAIVVVSAHWEEPAPTVTSAIEPALIFDYYGFPQHTYELQYPAPGEPALAARIRRLLGANGIASNDDPTRGFDHGVFIPFLLIEPEAAIPIVQLSLAANLDPQTHLGIGAALEPLRDEGVLIVGSGMSHHNLREFFASSAARDTRRFDTWLSATATAEPARRDAGLRDWLRAPDARAAHPREEHLLPLMVAAGAAGNDRGSRIFHGDIGAWPISGYRFG